MYKVYLKVKVSRVVKRHGLVVLVKQLMVNITD
jgi:hypothetical protein